MGSENGSGLGGPQLPRRNARVPLQAEVQLRRSGQRHYMVNVYDISPEGCRLEFVERPRLDETVWVKLGSLESIEANVCWVKGTMSVSSSCVRSILPYSRRRSRS
ncbi:PilZ domain-containing protein [Sphingomonas daechungensis]|uniref:PilZ domain-containing protein n=1 Tax=Sphingomonas daechungensis TaxID=1176646 RepID=A0ABX6T0W4_9SPHN|nr:PilZ domain-containing protein [Sphingomonas daechungensis]